MSPLENFTTEIFAYCLSEDVVFRNSFLNLLGRTELGDCFVSTQKVFNQGRPDIEMCFSDSVYLFEIKIESLEGERQLERYHEILQENYSGKRKTLVYLTKLFDPKEIVSQEIGFQQVRWYQIFNLISTTNLPVTQEFRKFLKNKGMEKSADFNVHDISALLNIHEAITKMDEVLQLFKPEFINRFGGYSTKASRGTYLANGYYGNYVAYPTLRRKLQREFDPKLVKEQFPGIYSNAKSMRDIVDWYSFEEVWSSSENDLDPAKK